VLQELFNVLDLPGSSVRDIFAGENPLDQWASPLSDRHRVSGAELVSKYTGARPDSWGSTIAGFGAEMLLDPTNLIGGAGMLKRAIAARRAMTANRSIDALNAGADVANLGRYGMVNAGRVDDLSSPLTAIPAAVPESITGRGLPYDPRVGYQAEPFYSKIQEVAERGKLPNQVGPDQLRGTLLGAGVSPEELDDLASPLSEAFANAPRGKLTRDDVYNVGADSVYGGLELETLGSPEWFEAQKEIHTLTGDRGLLMQYLERAGSDWPVDRARAAKLLQERPHLQKYLQNGDVSEQLLGLNERIEELRDVMSDMPEAPQFSLYRVPGGKPGTYQETLIKSPLSGYYSDGHFVGHGDTIAHLRSDVIKLPDGRDSLRITEVQSDWHQAGQKQGYGKPGETLLSPDQLRRVNEHLAWMLDEEDIEALPLNINDYVNLPENTLKEYIEDTIDQVKFGMPPGEDLNVDLDKVWSELERNRYVGPQSDYAETFGSSGIPDAPFKNSWHELALKTALHKAVTEGHDTISLVKGVDSAVASSGPEDKLGKFYDDKVFNAMKKIIKKHGGDVKEMSIRESNPINLDDAATDVAKRKFAASPLNVSVFEIPKSLKKEILRKGLPTYGTGSPLDPAIYGKTPERMIGSVQVKDVLRRSAGDSPLMPSEDLMTSPLMPRQEVPRILRPREAFGLVAYNAGARSGGYTVEP